MIGFLSSNKIVNIYGNTYKDMPDYKYYISKELNKLNQEKINIEKSYLKIKNNTFNNKVKLTNYYEYNPKYKINYYKHPFYIQLSNNKLSFINIIQIKNLCEDEINCIYHIFKNLSEQYLFDFACERYQNIVKGIDSVKLIDYEFAYNLYKFFNVKKFISNNYIIYNLNCIFSFHDLKEIKHNIYCEASFIFNKNNNKAELLFIKEIGKIIVPMIFYKYEKIYNPFYIDNSCLSNNDQLQYILKPIKIIKYI